MRNSRLLRYLIVGGTAYLMEMAILYGFRDGLHFSPVKSVAISFWFGLVFAFTLQKLVTFQNREKRIHMLGFQVAVYACLVLLNYIISLIATKLLSDRFSVFAIRTAVIVLSTIWNYTVYKWLFGKKTLELNNSDAQTKTQ